MTTGWGMLGPAGTGRGKHLVVEGLVVGSRVRGLGEGVLPSSGDVITALGDGDVPRHGCGGLGAEGGGRGIL